MAKRIDYYLSLNSPWAYLGSTRLEQIAARHGAEIIIKPVDFGRVFPNSGGLPLAKRAPQRQAYRMMELKRWREHLQMPLTLQPKHFPMAEGLAAHMVTAARMRYGSGPAIRLAHAVLRALWAEEKNTADPAVLQSICGDIGLDGAALMAAAQQPETIRQYEQDTEEAMARGIFGAPSFVVNDEIFWGQDRLEFLDRALARA